MVDESDAHFIKMANWSACKRRGTHYVQGSLNGKTQLLHRLITGAIKGQVVDHINKSALDNRRCNLRVCSYSENNMNRTRQARGASGFKGVSIGWKGRFVARITIDGKLKNLGTWDTANEAATAYDIAARALHKEFSSINF